MINYRTGNFLDDPDAQVFVFPANGVVTRDGRLVMGKGAAEAVRDKFKQNDIDKAFGEKLNSKRIIHDTNGIKYGFMTWTLFDFEVMSNVTIIALQTKYDFRNPSNLELIDFSLSRFGHAANDRNEKDTRIISMAYPGIGLGGLTKAEVQPLLEKHLGFLGDRLRVYDFETRE